MRAVAPGHHRRDRSAVQGNFRIEPGVGVRGQAAPIGLGFIPLLALWCKGPTGAIRDRLVVRRDDAETSARLDGHVADRHPPFHRHPVDRRAGIFDGIAGPAGGADLFDHREDDILTADPKTKLAGEGDPHGLGRALPQGLGDQNMFHLGRADTEGDTAERAMGRGMGVATNQGQAGQGNALFRANDMDDAVPLVSHREMVEAEVIGGLLQAGHGLAHLTLGNVLDGLGGGWHAVIGNAK